MGGFQGSTCGSGCAFELAGGATLSLQYLQMSGRLTALAGSELVLTDCLLTAQSQLDLHDSRATVTGTMLQSAEIQGIQIAGGSLSIRSSELSSSLHIGPDLYGYVGQGTEVSLEACTINNTKIHPNYADRTVPVRFEVIGGELHLSTLELPLTVFASAQRSLIDYQSLVAQRDGRVGSIHLDRVTSDPMYYSGELTGTISGPVEDITGKNTMILDPPNFLGAAIFVVQSGPCTTVNNNRCVGRPGTRPTCAASTPANTYINPEFVCCPQGITLASGAQFEWTSNADSQGDPRGAGVGQPFNMYQLGGGWEICF